jgi:serine phosphatase RsbU (regulator of sigma subunit)
MASLIIDNRDRSLVYAYAGHPAILRGRTGRFERIRPASDRFGNIPLGVLPATRFEQYYTQLEPGDVLAIYTDAFTEARGEDGEFLGEAGLARVLEGAGSMAPDELKTHVLTTLGDDFDDDASLVILEVL